MENSVLNSGVLSESRPVVLALIDLSLFPLLWLFPLSLHSSPPPLSLLRVSSGAISPSRSTDHESDSVFFLPLSLFLDCSSDITLAAVVVGSVSLHSSCRIKVDHSREHYPAESNQEWCKTILLCQFKFPQLFWTINPGNVSMKDLRADTNWQKVIFFPFIYWLL